MAYNISMSQIVKICENHKMYISYALKKQIKTTKNGSLSRDQLCMKKQNYMTLVLIKKCPFVAQYQNIFNNNKCLNRPVISKWMAHTQYNGYGCYFGAALTRVLLL